MSYGCGVRDNRLQGQFELVLSRSWHMQKRIILDWWQAMTPLARLLAIALVAPLLVLNAWAISSIFDYFNSLIVILVAASLLAFLLNYPVSWMESQGAKREQVAVLVFLLALSLIHI